MSKDYCAYCRRRTEHIKNEEHMLCKRCGKQGKRLKISESLTKKWSAWKTP